MRIVDLTIRGALIRLPSHEPPLAVGSLVHLEVVGARGLELVVVARVVRVDESGPVRAYGIAFLEPAAIEARLTPELARLFNRRRVRRLALGGVRAEIAGPRSTWTAAVRDISYDALSLEAATPAAPLEPGDPVVVRVALPDGGAPFELRGVLAVRREGERGSRVLVHFDQGEDNLDARQRVLDYVEADEQVH